MAVGEKNVPSGRLGIGVDIGSTATKVAMVDATGELVRTELMPTGFSSVDAAERARAAWKGDGHFCTLAACVVATGYGRVAVPYADKVVTEITCHGRGAARLFGPDGTVIDVGGQDTKVIRLRGGRVFKFVMNDKCAAGTGRFLEVMADRLGVSHDELSALAQIRNFALGVITNPITWIVLGVFVVLIIVSIVRGWRRRRSSSQPLHHRSPSQPLNSTPPRSRGTHFK